MPLDKETGLRLGAIILAVAIVAAIFMGCARNSDAYWGGLAKGVGDQIKKPKDGRKA